MINNLSKHNQKDAQQGNILVFFHLDTLKTKWNGIKNGMENGKFDPKMDTIRAFSQKNQCFFFFQFSEVGSGGLPLHRGCAPVSVPEYASISLNIPKYPLKCLNKLFYV